MTQSEALNILSKIAQGKATQTELNTLAGEIANGKFNFETVGGEDISKGGFSYNMNALVDYQMALEKINKKLKDGLKAHKEGEKYTEKEQKTINECIVLYEELLRQREKRNEFDRLSNKQLREGLTLQEKATKNLTEWAEKRNINTDKFKTGFNEVKSAVNGFGKVLKDTLEPWSKLDQAASQYTRTIGGSAASMKELRKSTIDFMETRGIGMKYNTSMEELIKLQSSYNASIGRSISLTNDQKESFAAMKAVAGEQTAVEFTTKLENFGLNPDEVGKRMGEMFGKASKSGVAFEKYSKNFLDNIKLAQNYNFTNGLKGLSEMAKKATEVKLNMQQVAAFAEKVSSLEGAMTTGANLSVLGGSFARFGNPLQMLYEGLNDMESLQDRVVNMFGDLGKWDYAKGQVDVSVFNKQRIRAAAQAMGMDYGEVMQMVNANARRNIVEGQLGGLGADIRNDKEMRDLILNKAQLDENGRAFVTIDGEKRDLSKITAADRKALQRENASDSDNIKEIATNTRSFKDLMEGFDKQKEAFLAGGIEKSGIGDTIKGLFATVTQNSTVMQILAWMPQIAQLIGSVAMFGNGTGNIFGSFGKGGATVLGKATGRTIPKGATRVNGTWMKANGTPYSKNWQTSLTKITENSKKAAGNTRKGLLRGMSGSIRGGVGMAASIGGMYAEQALESGNLGQNKGKNIAGYAFSKAGTEALKWGGMGAMFGWPGAAIGAALGAAWGGYTGYRDAKKDQLANTLRGKPWNLGNINPENYTIEELQAMIGGAGAVVSRPGLKQKMMNNGDILQGFSKGGYTGNGSTLEPAGIVHKGEYVMNASDVDDVKNGNVLKPLGNMLNQLQVSKNTVNTSSSSVGAGSIDLNINVGGKIDLEANGAAKTISGTEILTNEMIDTIIRKIQERTNYALNKDKTHIKFM